MPYSTQNVIALAGESLTGNRDYYVNESTGSDSNDGLTVGNPFETIKKAVEVASVINVREFVITINIADGTYDINDADRIILPPYPRTTGYIKLEGNTSTPENVKIQPTAAWSLDEDNSHTGVIHQTGGYWVIGGLGFADAPLTAIVDDVNAILVDGPGSEMLIEDDLIWFDNVFGAGARFICLRASNCAHVKIRNATLRFDSESIDASGTHRHGVLVENNAYVDFGLWAADSGNITFETGTTFLGSTFFLRNGGGLRTVEVTYTGTNTANGFFQDHQGNTTHHLTGNLPSGEVSGSFVNGGQSY